MKLPQRLTHDIPVAHEAVQYPVDRGNLCGSLCSLFPSFMEVFVGPYVDYPCRSGKRPRFLIFDIPAVHAASVMPYAQYPQQS